MRTRILGYWAVTILTSSLFPSLACSSSPAVQSTPRPTSLGPSEEAARRNAFKVFNSLHSAMRQWGSSLDHNGMSYFLATVPEGSIFFHGAPSPERPNGMEWLAFEMEHAQVFSRSQDPQDYWGKERGGHGDGGETLMRGLLRHDARGIKALLDRDGSGGAWHLQDNGHDQQRFLAPSEDDERASASFDKGDDNDRQPRPPKPHRGYLQTYRALRPLNLLYIDGMAAGKSGYGTLDTQDYVLLGWDENEPQPPEFAWTHELARAHELCGLAKREWRDKGTPIDGFVRMEAGFEIIYCSFEEGGGLELVANDGSPFRNESGWVDWSVAHFEWLRACSLRYDGLPAGRITVDWSSMVSAFFYDVNLTNPDPTRSELPRVLNMKKWQREVIKDRVVEVLDERHPEKPDGKVQRGLDWQGVVDMIVTRYSDRLAMLSSGNLSVDDTRSVVDFLLSPFTDITPETAHKPSLARCKSLYLEPILAQNATWTPTDRLIHAAIDTVSETICKVLLDSWTVLNAPSGDPTLKRYMSGVVHGAIKELVELLRWSTWRRCGPCGSLDRICFVAMFPAGTAEDHYTPRCKDVGEIRESGSHYWIPRRPS